ncbi:MAG TPA: glycolate oxidase subunit GlcE [Ramlibacter sp.]|uniref:glycolate oxidase subunit GlcE n=1 Tax=Ramlibacter sp. TaxID=1917967 RepID=UPI002B7FE41F|nr:glycolate oxidase subunit GlcE [Ramlibacter sp.]HVZ42734.1 glycolate oxidase subunit GlcE [Ramlibacter sp.]
MGPTLSAILDRVRDAAAHGAPLVIRGGGSKDFYGEPGEGEVLDTRALSGIVIYEPSELVVTARAGTPLAELEALLAERGQCLPFEPPYFGGQPTVGGMVACGLSGPARAVAGSVRDYVLGLELVNGRGEQLVFGGQVMKNVAGYDVSRLMVGALGTLGLVTEVSLKVLPAAPCDATLAFELTQEAALKHLAAWGAQPLPLNASRWCEEDGRGRLSVRLRGATAAVEAACRALGGERIDSARAAREWQDCRDHRLDWFAALGERGLWRLSVAQTAPVMALPDTPLVEWHGGLRWVRAQEEEGAALRAAAQAAGGHATLFRTAGASAHPRFHPLAGPAEHIHRELKRQFDPAGIFNRGRLYRDF